MPHCVRRFRATPFFLPLGAAAMLVCALALSGCGAPAVKAANSSAAAGGANDKLAEVTQKISQNSAAEQSCHIPHPAPRMCRGTREPVVVQEGPVLDSWCVRWGRGQCVERDGQLQFVSGFPNWIKVFGHDGNQRTGELEVKPD